MERSLTLMRQAASLVSSSYRIYLLDENASIEAAEFYTAKDDTEATEIAASLHASCSDAFRSYELWHGRERIAQCVTDRGADPDIAALHKYQDVILGLEKRLEKSFACLKRSRKLAEAARQLRELRHGFV
jgi:hypothetical protein